METERGQMNGRKDMQRRETRRSKKGLSQAGMVLIIEYRIRSSFILQC